MAKTYVPMAVNFAEMLHKRLTRYQSRLTESALTPAQQSSLIELISCLATFLTNWHRPPVVD